MSRGWDGCGAGEGEEVMLKRNNLEHSVVRKGIYLTLDCRSQIPDRKAFGYPQYKEPVLAVKDKPMACLCPEMSYGALMQ